MSEAAPDHSPSARRNPRPLVYRWPSHRNASAKRLSELRNLAQLRREVDVLIDINAFAWAMAATLAQAPAGTYTITRDLTEVEWGGARLGTLRHALERADLGRFDDHMLASLIEKVTTWRDKHGECDVPAKYLGDLLKLTAAERKACRITTIDACDEPAAQRRERVAEWKRAWDRQVGEKKRRAAGAQPRAEYEANSISQQKPWQAMGISKSTWYRHHRHSFVEQPRHG